MSRRLLPPRPCARHAAWWVVGVTVAAAALALCGPVRAAHADPTTTQPATTLVPPVTFLPGAPSPAPSTPPATIPGPAAPAAPKAPTTTAAGSQITVNLGNTLSKPSESLTIIIGLTLLSVAPALLIMLTSFTRVIIVLSLTRNALGVQTVPPSQVLAGLALFITLFIMSPVITAINHDAVQPYLHGVEDGRGETALIALGGELSHAIHKGPMLAGAPAETFADGLYVRERIAAREPTAAERELAMRVLAFVAARFGPLPYARIDVVPGPDEGAPVVLEVELAEPSLFLGTSTGAPERFAAAIAALLV